MSSSILPARDFCGLGFLDIAPSALNPEKRSHKWLKSWALQATLLRVPFADPNWLAPDLSEAHDFSMTVGMSDDRIGCYPNK